MEHPSSLSTLDSRLSTIPTLDYSDERILVLGLGNPLIRDDSVGLRVVAELAHVLMGYPGVEIEEDYRGGLRLMERMAGYDRAVIIDAIQSGKAPGTIHQLTVHSIPTQRSVSAHDVNLLTALEVGRQAGWSLPVNEHVYLVGIEAEDILTFDEECTPAVRAAIPEAVRLVKELVDTFPRGNNP